ncbi:hypothetical protein J6590_075719 [Homalodisca vitripennis]|nr:hypothetical protein J6590_075719 [Homalodisca vitripennis]
MFHMEPLLRTRQIQYQGTKLLSVDQVKEMSELAEAPQYYFGSDCRLSVGPHQQRTEIRLLTALDQ